jgi:hypothetical protein
MRLSEISQARATSTRCADTSIPIIFIVSQHNKNSYITHESPKGVTTHIRTGAIEFLSVQQGWNLLHARELIWHSHEDLGAVKTTHLIPKELKLVRGRDRCPRLPFFKGEVSTARASSHLQAGINPIATNAT